MTSDELCGRVISVGRRRHRRVWCQTCYRAIFENIGKPKHWREV